MTSLRIGSFQAQAARWPASGRHVLAQFDDDSVVVYQAYRRRSGALPPSTATSAAGSRWTA
jgi:hypothetical protein